MRTDPSDLSERDRKSDGELLRFNGDEYHKMGDVGILGESDELIDGVVVVRGNWNVWRWTCDDYRVMRSTEIIAKEELTELIQGEVARLPMVTTCHALARTALWQMLVDHKPLMFGHEALVKAQIVISNDTEVQPDITVIEGLIDEYKGRYPAPADVRLIVEVAGRDLETDQTKKYMLYARAGIPEYWLVNLRTHMIECYRQPSGAGYRQRSPYEAGQSLSPIVAPDLTI